MPYYAMIHTHEPLADVSAIAAPTLTQRWARGFGAMFITARVWSEGVAPPGTPNLSIPQRLTSLVACVCGEIGVPAHKQNARASKLRAIYENTPRNLTLITIQDEGPLFFPADHENHSDFPGPVMERVNLVAYYTERRLADANPPFALIVRLATENLPGFPPITANDVQNYLAESLDSL